MIGLDASRFVRTQDFDRTKPGFAPFDMWIDRLIGDLNFQFIEQLNDERDRRGIAKDELMSDLDPQTQFEVWEKATHGISY